MEWQLTMSGITGDWLIPLITNLDLWRGAARFVLDLFLLYALLVVVLTVSGHPVAAWPLHRSTDRKTRTDPNAGQVPVSAEEGMSHSAGHRRESTEQHLEVLDRLNTALKYQGSTVVLIVFAVLLLGVQHILGATEIATILSGIAGFVLGQSKTTSDNTPTTETTPPASGTTSRNTPPS